MCSILKYNVTILEHLSHKVFFYNIVSKPTSNMVWGVKRKARFRYFNISPRATPTKIFGRLVLKSWLKVCLLLLYIDHIAGVWLLFEALWLVGFKNKLPIEFLLRKIFCFVWVFFNFGLGLEGPVECNRDRSCFVCKWRKCQVMEKFGRKFSVLEYIYFI